MRKLMAILLCAAPFAASGGESSVMLDQPGTWESIRKEDPARYKQLLAILAAAEKYGCSADLTAGLRAQFGVTAAKCTGYAMMTEPQKARLTFRLGDTQYSTIWVPSRSQGRNGS